MSLESYVTGLMKEPAPKGMDRLVLSGLSQLEKCISLRSKRRGRQIWPLRSPPMYP